MQISAHELWRASSRTTPGGKANWQRSSNPMKPERNHLQTIPTQAERSPATVRFVESHFALGNLFSNFKCVCLSPGFPLRGCFSHLQATTTQRNKIRAGTSVKSKSNLESRPENSKLKATCLERQVS